MFLLTLSVYSYKCSGSSFDLVKPSFKIKHVLITVVKIHLKTHTYTCTYHTPATQKITSVHTHRFLGHFVSVTFLPTVSCSCVIIIFKENKTFKL